MPPSLAPCRPVKQARAATLWQWRFRSLSATIASYAFRFRVCAVPHSGHALLLCRTERFDVAIVEFAGPDISGPSLLEQLRRHQPTLSSVYLANPGSPEGVEHLLVHPFTTEDLLGEIHGALSSIAA